MSRAPAVLHQYGRPVKARDVDGQEIYREDRIFFQGQWYRVMDYDNHFVYKSKKVGPALMCTCGSPSAAVGYDQYKKYTSFRGMQIIACLSHTTTGKHADGSS